MLRLALIAVLSFATTACAVTRDIQTSFAQQATHEPRQCPLGGTTEIQATGPAPRDMALNMAAKATLRDGFQKFTIVRSGPVNQGRSYSLLIRMAHLDDATDPGQTVMADALAATPTQI